MSRENKNQRILNLYHQLMQGQSIQKRQAALDYEVDERTIQRDISDIRSFLENPLTVGKQKFSLIYDPRESSYRLHEEKTDHLADREILAISKILLDSRALTKKEMYRIIDKLLAGSCQGNNKLLTELIRNEKFHYVELQHKKDLLERIFELGTAVQEKRLIEIEYRRTKDKMLVKRKLQPVSILFSEFYFYLTAFIDGIDKEEHFENKDDLFPTIYRIDRIVSLKILDEHFRQPYAKRFEEGEFRKRIQFMYGGRLNRIRFKYKGDSAEAVLDRLPTAKILLEKDGVFTITAEVFGKGIDMWLRSQGDKVELCE